MSDGAMTESGPSTDLADYPSRESVPLRYADTDRQGHVNNAIFATMCESGRAAMLYDGERLMAPEGTQFVIARLVLDFIDELHWPGVVDIGTRVKRIGRSSMTLEQGLFEDGRCVGTAETVIVLTDQTTRKSTPLPGEIVSVLEGLRGPA